MKRQMVAEVMSAHQLSQRRACGLIGITRRGFQRAPVEDRNHRLRHRLRELAEERRRWGCPLLYLMLRREGWRAYHKRVERLYREEGLSLRRRRRRKRLSHLRVAHERPVTANQTWAVDFIHDSLISGRHFRAFAVLDQWSRESLAIEVDLSLTGERVTQVLERLRTTRGLPLVIQADNGPELGGRGSTGGTMQATGFLAIRRGFLGPVQNSPDFSNIDRISWLGGSLLISRNISLASSDSES